MPGPLFRIPASASLGFVVETRHLSLSRRERAKLSDNPKSTTIVVASVVGGIIVLVGVIILIRSLRSRYPNPKYIPTPYLKRRWTKWQIKEYSRARHAYEQAGGGEDDANHTSSRRRGRGNTSETATAQTRERDSTTTANTTDDTAGIDRNTSVRSVMTLPVYRQRPAETEQVLGREGERDGIDVVVEMPTAEDEEAMREEEMNALYQIRLARRQQIAEREERRRLRREARDNNNVVALQEIRQQTRDASGRNTETIEELRAEHERIRTTRERTVSSVSYADLGVARLDGTRIRANSTESERVGLLSDAASIGNSVVGGGGGGGRSVSAGGDVTFPLPHRRERSTGSIVSIDTARSNSNEIPPESPSLLTGSTYSLASMGRVRSDSGVNTPRRLSIGNTPRAGSRAGSSPEIIDAEDGDLGDTSMPPPGYDDVSLDEVNNNSRTGAGDISGRNSPYNEPPPDYPGGPAQWRNNRLSAHMEDLAAASGSRSRANSSTASPQLPELPLQLPQIVIDPASGR